MSTIPGITVSPLTASGDTADLLGWERLHEALSAVGVGCYRRYAPYSISGSGESYVVVFEADNGWARDAYHSGIRHSVLVVNCYADDSRDDEGNPTNLDASGRALALYEITDKLLDLQSAADWPAVITSRRQAEPSCHDIPDGDGSVLLSARYELSL